MISTILDRISPIDNLESQIDYLKAAFETDFNEHFPTLRELKQKAYKQYNLKPSQIIFNLLILFNSFSGKVLLFNDVEATKEVLVYLKDLIKDDSYWKKYKKLKKLLKRIVEIINVRIPYGGSYISKVNKSFNDAIDKIKSPELYDIILKRLETITKRDNKENKALLDKYDIYHKLLRRNISEKEYKECMDKIDETVPKQYDIVLNGRKDYIRTITNYINKIEDVRESIKKDEEQHKETTIEDEKKESTNDDDEFKGFLDGDFEQSENKGLNAYKITINEAVISNDDLVNRPQIKELESETYYSNYTNEDDIKDDITEQIKIKSFLGSQVISSGGLSFSFRPIKEEYHANINGDCLKVALKCYNINFDGRFEDIITNEEILNKIGFYNIYGNFVFGNIKTNDKILLYEGHAVAINTNFKRIHTKDKITTQTITYKEFNHKINLCKSYNIPYRCFNNKVNKGYIEIFESESDFNEYNKPITGMWIKYKYIIDDPDDIEFNERKLYYAYDSDDDYEDVGEDMDEYFGQLDEETLDSEKCEDFKVSDDYYTQMEDNNNDTQYINIQTMEYEFINTMKEAHEEFIKLTTWFDNKIIEQCKSIMNDYDIKCMDEYINKHKFDIIPPVFPYGYRERCQYTKYIRGDEVYRRLYCSIDMNKSYLTAFKEMKSIFCISNVPMKEIMKGTTINDYIIFVKSDIVYNGFYKPVAIDCIKSLDSKATFEYYRIYKYFNINTENININNYKIVFGMLISGATNYKYMDSTNNTYIKDVRADYDYNALLHLNIMITRNMIMLIEIVKQFRVNKVLPAGYVVDSILYDSYDNIKKAQTKYFKDVEQIEKYDDVEPKYIQKYNYHFGVAGSGKSTELSKLYRENEVVIVNNYNLYKMYQDKNINVILWQRFLNEHQSIYATKIYIDEIFTFLNTDIERLFYICNVNDIEVSLFGDYNQLEPIIDSFYINRLNNCLRYVEHDYKYTNYRNTLEYDGKDAWIMDINNNSLKNKRKEYINRLINAGFVKISNKGKTIRYYKKDAEQNEKTYKGKYYMIKNYGNTTVPSKLKLICQTDVLYTKEELKEILGDKYNKYIRYFVNNNCVSFYNTQGQTLKKIHIINSETIDSISKNGRMFYVFVSRLQGNISI